MTKYNTLSSQAALSSDQTTAGRDRSVARGTNWSGERARWKARWSALDCREEQLVISAAEQRKQPSGNFYQPEQLQKHKNKLLVQLGAESLTAEAPQSVRPLDALQLWQQLTNTVFFRKISFRFGLTFLCHNHHGIISIVGIIIIQH